METISERGIAIRGNNGGSKFIKNRNIVITTKREPSMSAFFILLIEA